MHLYGISNAEKERRIRLSKALALSRLKRKKEAQKKKREEEKKKREARKEKEKELRKIRKKKERLEKREKEKEARKKEKQRLKLKKLRELQKHKRKPGRPKKRGPKRKRKRNKNVVAVPKPKRIISYKILGVKNGKQKLVVGKYYTMEEAYENFERVKKENDDVIFPVEIEHNQTISAPKFEYLLMERNIDGTKTDAMLRNDIGKIVEQKTNINDWVIIDKTKRNVEETFWVWGYDKSRDRKTFKWIYDNLLIATIENIYDIKRVILFKNKIVFKSDDDSIKVIFCKVAADAVRFYNKLEEFIKKDKIKQVFFLGNYGTKPITDKRLKLEEDIMALTGWNRYKVRMSSTTKHITGEKSKKNEQDNIIS